MSNRRDNPTPHLGISSQRTPTPTPIPTTEHTRKQQKKRLHPAIQPPDQKHGPRPPSQQDSWCWHPLGSRIYADPRYPAPHGPALPSL
ncbi:hypothetical protein B0H67DRAFT_347599 [Lasiosphaeris hirsuta]|uniref:Uncharacterized protein n=1 Tax=Lasiosphaeris hirsuta TaxID=260670 RepID=A0AA40DK64_9PEZI|nr:hypothetical protein B0H67DRAFT_347599 [Lasiosphaeris hirsuta]